MTKKLSLLVPSLASRSTLLYRLLNVLNPQVTPDVEVLIQIDDGSQTIGEKRNDLLRSATGEYVAGIDDDDLVSTDYVKQMLIGIKKGVDAVCLRGIFKQDGVDMGDFVDNPFTTWRAIVEDGRTVHLRGFQHLDAVRREIAQLARFEPRNFGEDRLWSAAVEATGMLRTWHCIETPIYIYDYVSKK